MKKTSKLLALVLALMFMLQAVSMAASAAAPYEVITPSEMQRSVVQIWTQFVFTGKNYKLRFNKNIGGTGFAIGEVGKPIMHIATCFHCVEKRDGMWFVVYDEDGLQYAEPVDDGVKAKTWEEYGMTCVIDYFEIRSTPYAIFSESTGERVKLSVVASNYDRDVAICKLALKDPITKLEARPLLWRSDEATKVGDTVYAIGYPGNADYANDEGRGDYSDSVVTKGVISKVQLTTGLTDAKEQYYTFMIDANITNGNSGGPLFTEKGSIIGLDSFQVESEFSLTAPAQYAIAIEEVIKLAETNHIKIEVIDNEKDTYIDSDKPAVTEPTTEPEKKETNGLVIGIIAGAVVLVALIAVVIIMLMKKKPNGNNGNTNVGYQQNGYQQNGYQQNGYQPQQNNYQPQMQNQNTYNPVPQPATARGGSTTGPTIYIPNEEKLCIVCVGGPLEGQKFAIEEKALIGRDPAQCDIVFAANQPGVSNIHCEVFRSGNMLSVKDCGSSYGTFLKNGTKLTPNAPVVLQNGDQFMVGDKHIIFEARY